MLNSANQNPNALSCQTNDLSGYLHTQIY